MKRWLIEPNAAGDLVCWGLDGTRVAFWVEQDGEWVRDSDALPNEAELGLVHVLRGDGYVISASEMPCVHDAKLIVKMTENEYPTEDEPNATSQLNLDPKAQNVKRVGWSAEDRAMETLDMLNAVTKNPNPWQKSDLIKKSFAIQSYDFLEGVLTAGLWFGGFISGGRLREMVRDRDHDSTMDPLMVQRLLEYIEVNKEDIS